MRAGVADRLIYLDNAATTFPKPVSVLNTMVQTYMRAGVSPGRGSYDLAAEAGQLVAGARQKVARVFHAPDPDRVVFTANATDALNIALQGMVRLGDHVVSTRLEHNSVLRPLHHLRLKGLIEYDLIPFDDKGFVDPGDIMAAIRPNTRLVIINHVSNVLGTVQPVPEIGRRCAELGIPLFVDVAQSAGVLPIDMESWRVAGIAFTGHKSMLGPTGIGGLVLAPGVEVEPTRFGGTGFESLSLVHPDSFPYRLETGTHNLMGIIGLSEALDYLQSRGIESIHAREMELLRRLLEGLSGCDGIRIFGAENLSDHLGLLAANIRGMDPEDVGAILDADFHIAVRVGLHCAPLLHQSIGTSPRGTIRFSIGPFNTEEDIDETVTAMKTIARSKG
jgi:cysteine desulfurase / selenocysteine lyase